MNSAASSARCAGSAQPATPPFHTTSDTLCSSSNQSPTADREISSIPGPSRVTTSQAANNTKPPVKPAKGALPQPAKKSKEMLLLAAASAARQSIKEDDDCLLTGITPCSVDEAKDDEVVFNGRTDQKKWPFQAVHDLCNNERVVAMPNAYSATCEDVHGWLHTVVMLKKRREVVRFYIRVDDEGHVVSCSAKDYTLHAASVLNTSQQQEAPALVARDSNTLQQQQAAASNTSQQQPPAASAASAPTTSQQQPPLHMITRSFSSPTTRALALHSPSAVQSNPVQPFSQEPTKLLRPLPSSTLQQHATFMGLSSLSTFSTPAIAIERLSSQQAASVAITQPHGASSRPTRRNLFGVFDAATSNRGGAATSFVVPARPTVGQSAVECTPLSDSDAHLDIGAFIMLRDVAQLGTCLRIPLMPVANHKCYTPTVGISGGVKFPIFEFEQAAFIIDDFGTNFTGVYPDHVQKVLDAFKLNETNRCFYLALGIGTNIDPFLLQCLFRRHARYVTQNKTVLLNSTGGDADATGQLQGSIDSELDSLKNVLEPGSSIDCSVLRYLWPIEFDNFRIVVICKRPDRTGVARYNVVVFNSSSTDDACIQASQDVERKQTIFLKLENGHYTLLTLIQGSVDVSDAHISQWFAHDINEGLRCPSITTMNFQEKVFPEVYVASAVDGTVPNVDQVNAIWLRITARHGIAFGPKGEWVKGLPRGVATTDENQQGSIDVASFTNVRNALLNALEAKENSTDSTTSSSSLRLSRSAKSVSAHASPPCVHASLLRASVPCVFLDLGSESGRALVRMLHDDRITHAAGVEHQIPWFQLSVTLFQEIRQAFVDARLRMPAITLFRSCMRVSSRRSAAAEHNLPALHAASRRPAVQGMSQQLGDECRVRAFDIPGDLG